MFRRILCILVLLSPLRALAEPRTEGHHGAHAASALIAQIREPGQSAFAAIQEVVTLLEADPATDWANVDIAALHRHLVDMSNLTLLANVAAESVKGVVRYTITGAGPVRDSIRRMVAAHAEAVAGYRGWRFEAREHPAGAILTITVDKPGDVVTLGALGFIGVMTLGMHHQAHHLAIATGRGPHQ